MRARRYGTFTFLLLRRRIPTPHWPFLLALKNWTQKVCSSYWIISRFRCQRRSPLELSFARPDAASPIGDIPENACQRRWPVNVFPGTPRSVGLGDLFLKNACQRRKRITFRHRKRRAGLLLPPAFKVSQLVVSATGPRPWLSGPQHPWQQAEAPACP